MQRFRFQLDSVLSWRRTQLEIEKSKLERIFAERHAIDAEAATLDQTGREASTQLLAAKSIDPQQLVALDSYRHHLAREAGRIAAKRADCEKRIAAQQKQVMDAERRVRLLERLKERRLAEWNLEFTKELDTLASEAFLSRLVRESRQ